MTLAQAGCVTLDLCGRRADDCREVQALRVQTSLILVVIGSALLSAVWRVDGAKAVVPTMTFSAATAPRMSRTEVRQVAFAIMADNARRLGRSLSTPRLIAISLVKPDVFWPNRAVGHRSGARFPVLWWAVRVRGTLMNCGGTTCGISSRGGFAIEDANHFERGGWLEGHITIIPVGQVKP
jgi:hypothetical protein